METVIATREITTDMKKKLKDIQMAISWRDFANTYFQRSSFSDPHRGFTTRWMV